MVITDYEKENLKADIWGLLPTFGLTEDEWPISAERKQEIIQETSKLLSYLVAEVVNEKIKAAEMDLEFNKDFA